MDILWSFRSLFRWIKGDIVRVRMSDQELDIFLSFPTYKRQKVVSIKKERNGMNLVSILRKGENRK